MADPIFIEELNSSMINHEASSFIVSSKSKHYLEDNFSELFHTQFIFHSPSETVFDHSLKCLEIASQKPLIIQWAALLHDLGKVNTFRKRNGLVTFHCHEDHGARIAENILFRILPDYQVLEIVKLIKYHMFALTGSEREASIIRFGMKLEKLSTFNDLIQLRLIDRLGKLSNQGKSLFNNELVFLIERIRSLKNLDKIIFKEDLKIDTEVNNIINNPRLVHSALVDIACRINAKQLENNTEDIKQQLILFKQNNSSSI